jgi:hypothetical protein
VRWLEAVLVHIAVGAGGGTAQKHLRGHVAKLLSKQLSMAPFGYNAVRLIGRCDQWQGDLVAKGLVASRCAGAESSVTAGIELVRVFTNASTSDISKSNKSCTIQASANVVAVGNGLGEAGDALGPSCVSSLVLELHCSWANLRQRSINVDSQRGKMHAEVVSSCSVSMLAAALAVQALARAVGCVRARTVALLLGIKPGLGPQGARVATVPLRVAGGLVFHGVCQVCLAAAAGRVVLKALRALEDGNGQFANCGRHRRIGLDSILDDGVIARRELGRDDEAKGELQEHAWLVHIAPVIVHDQLVDGVPTSVGMRICRIAKTSLLMAARPTLP